MHRVLLICVAIVTLSGTAMGDDRDGPLTDGASDGTAAISESGLLMHPSLDVEALLATAAAHDVRPAARPGWLPALYANSIALQTYDIFSTMTALERGGVEINPLMRELTGHPGAWIAVKAGATALTIVAAERLWKRQHRTAAVATMIVSNSIMAFAAARNARVIAALH